MREQQPCAPVPGPDAPPPAKWADLRCLALLALLAVGLRAWQLTHTEVISRDGVSFVRIAWQLGNAPWREVLPRSPQHPGYPLAVLAASYPVRQFLPDDLPRAWQLSAQLVSALASVLLLVPMFYLGREVFDRRIAFWACALFQCLPTSGKVMGDALSDTLFLLWCCSALWLACVALRRRAWPLFALTGLFAGLAYLTRPEGVLVVAATGLVLLGGQLPGRSRKPWRGVLAGGGALAGASLAVMAPYMLAIGGLTVKNTPNIMMDRQRPDANWEERLRPHAPGQEKQAAAGGPLFALFWGPGDPEFDALAEKVQDLNDLPNHRPPSRYRWALKAMAIELGKAFFYVAWLPALVGLAGRRDRFRRAPGVWVGLLVCLLLCAALYRMAEKMGYLSDRHLLLVVLCGSYWAVAGAVLVGEKFALGASRLLPALAGRRWTDGRVWSAALLLLLVLPPLPRTLERLHGERAGFRGVGRWLADHTPAGDFVEDPYCWAYYYAGRVFVEGRAGLPAHQPPRFYAVLEASKNRHARLLGLQQMIQQMLRERGARIVHSEDVRRGKDRAALQVWEVPGPYLARPVPGLPGQR